MNTEQIIYNEILRESSEDVKYKPMEEVKNKDVEKIIAIVVFVLIVISFWLLVENNI